MTDKEKLEWLLKRLYELRGEANGIMETHHDDEDYKAIYGNQYDICNELIAVLEGRPHPLEELSGENS